MTESAEITTDVVIVGGGPVGCALGIFLARAGVGVVIVERDRHVYQLARAVMLDGEIRRAFADHDLDGHVDAMTTPMYGAEFIDAQGTRLLGMDVPPGTVGEFGFPQSNMFHQPEFDSMLRIVARERGVELLGGRTAVALDRGAHRVTVTADDGTRIEGSWLVGCDGASSWVRRQVGIGQTDLGFDQDWLVVDVGLHPDAEPDLPPIAQQVCDPHRPATFVPGHRLQRRWEFQLQPDEDPAEMQHPDRVWSLLAPWLGPEHGHLQRAVAYRFHAVVADRFRDGRVLLAGDAAHQMPPFLGQGLNSGLRDAANLAWKLAMVVGGTAGDGALDTYEIERKPHATALVEHAADVGRLIDQLAGRVSHGISESSGYGGGRPFPRLEAGAVHGDDPMVGRPLRVGRDGPDVGARRSDGFDLLVAHGTGRTGDSGGAIGVPTALGGLDVGLVRVDPATLRDHAAALVRPDRYVAAVADDQSELDAAGTAVAAALDLR